GVFSWLDEVSLFDGVFDGAFGGVRDDEFVGGDGVVRFSSSFVRSTKSFFWRYDGEFDFLKAMGGRGLSGIHSRKVTDMLKVDKIKAKRTKPSTRMKRVQESKAEGEFISNIIPLILYPK
nr:hypothetical protein [Tanacetum cinerariifolium]